MLFLQCNILTWLYMFVNLVAGQGEYRHKHGADFIPDAILRITVQNISQSCLPPKPVVLVNGTSPGPEIRLMEGGTYWIRVYNDMPHANLTMVDFPFYSSCFNCKDIKTWTNENSTGTA